MRVVTHGDADSQRVVGIGGGRGVGGTGKHVGECVTVRHCVTTLDALAARVAMLLPSRHDPEHFHAEKSAIASELRRLARQGGRNA